jgi:phosphate:Na+ symporter
METTMTLEYGTLFMTLLGGLAIFLFGMEQMDNALRLVAGARMKKVLSTLTTNRLTGVLTGALVTSVLQSSSVTTVLVVGFVSAGLMTLMQSIGVIMGANIGTTITAQIVAFKITHYALWMVAIGFVLHFVSKNDKVKQYGVMLLGLGLVFFGINLMGDATKPLREFAPFINLLHQMEHPLLGILVGALFTGIIQSSSATTGIVIVLAGQGLITLDAGIALAFGANIGTTITAMLASIGRPRPAVQAAVVHLLFNVAGVALWFFFIPQLAGFVTGMSPIHPELSGLDRMAAETPRQIANAHTLFNVINTLVFIWFVNPIARLVQFLVPERYTPTEVQVGPMRPKYLDAILLSTPTMALEQVRLEMGRLGEMVSEMVHQALSVTSRGSKYDMQELAQMDLDVDTLHDQIAAYLDRLSQHELLIEQSYQLSNFMAANNYIENVGNRVKINMVSAGTDRLKHGAAISDETLQLLTTLDNQVVEAIDTALNALACNKPVEAKKVLDLRPEIDFLLKQGEGHLTHRMTVNEPNRAILFHIEFEILEYHERIFYFAEKIAAVAANNSKPLPQKHVPTSRPKPEMATPVAA